MPRWTTALTFPIANGTESVSGNGTVKVYAQQGTEGKMQINEIADNKEWWATYSGSAFLRKEKQNSFAYGSEEHNVKLTPGLRLDIV